MRRGLFIILLIAALLAACRRSNPDAAALLARADSLLNPPPSPSASQTPPAGGPQGAVSCALHLLDSVQHQARTAWPKADRMRYEVLLAEAMNKGYVPFTTDSVLKQVVRYYDRHGSNDERLKAHYLLGCAYRDMGEAPIAILTWEDAITTADTTSADCDYHTLCAVYSQLSVAYHEKLLFSREISCLHSASAYSLLEGDTLYSIDVQRRVGSCYYLLHNYDSAEYYFHKSQALYHEHHYHQEGLLSSMPLINLYLELGRLEDAKSLMGKYESEFEEFDENHELPPHRRHYYCYKGQFYEQLGLLDSAAFFYRKAEYPGMNHSSYDPMYAGLLRVFQMKGQADSIAKYAQLYCAANDSSIAVTDRELTAQAAANYNYTRSQREALSQRERASKFAIALTIFGAALFVAVIIIGMIIRRNHERKKRQNIEIARLRKELKTTQAEYALQVRAFTQMETLHKTSMELLRQDIIRLSAENQEDRQKLEEAQTALKTMSLEFEKNSLALKEDIEKKKLKIETLEHQISKFNVGEITCDFEDDIIVKHIRKLVKARDTMLKRDFLKLREAGEIYFPLLMDELNNNKNITQRAIQACLLLLICDRVEDIACLMGVKASRVTNLKGDISVALFGKKDSRSLLQKMATHYGTPIP